MHHLGLDPYMKKNQMNFVRFKQFLMTLPGSQILKRYIADFEHDSCSQNFITEARIYKKRIDLIRACKKVLYQLVYIGKKFVFLKEPLYLINQ